MANCVAAVVDLGPRAPNNAAMFSVASYNIRKSLGTDRKRAPDRILDVLGEIDADIVALQEVDRRFGSRATTLSVENIVNNTAYDVVHFGARPASIGWHGNTILVRKGIEVITHRRLTLPALEPRGAVLADLHVNGRTVRVIGMHLGLVGLWRERQARAVLDHLEKLEQKLPTVIMGDLNQWSTEGGCLAHFAETHNVIAPGPSFHSSRPLLPLDRIITDLDLDVEGAGVHMSEKARRASDHLPVWAKLRIRDTPAAAPSFP
jgi:endonuclease/exonuclease/phosphatase family metal-dependent hydrolase